MSRPIFLSTFFDGVGECSHAEYHVLRVLRFTSGLMRTNVELWETPRAMTLISFSANTPDIAICLCNAASRPLIAATQAFDVLTDLTFLH